MSLIFKPYNFLVLTALLLLLASFFISPFDLNFKITDTYFIIPNIQFFRIHAIGLFIFAALYKFLDSYLTIKSITWIHIIIVLLFPLIIAFLSYSFSRSLALVEISNQGSPTYFERNERTINSIFFIFIALQILPIINFLFGAINMYKKAA